MALGIICLFILMRIHQSHELPDNKGTEFMIAFGENSPTEKDLELFITTPYTGGPVNVNVSVPLDSAVNDQKVTVSAGTIQKVSLSNSLRMSGPGTLNGPQNRGILVTATQEIIVYGSNKEKYSCDAFLALPTDVLGKDYFIPSWPKEASYQEPSQLGVVGVQNGTAVTFTFPSHLSEFKVATGSNNGGSYTYTKYNAGSTFSITLNRGQTYQLQSEQDLTSTRIQSDKPVAVMSGSLRTSIAVTGSSDHIEEMIPPTSSWGKYFITSPFAERTAGDIFRILVSVDNTEVQLTSTLDNTTTKETLSVGRFKELDVSSNEFYYISASEQIMVVQYSKTSDADGKESDPFMTLNVPIEQFSKDYTFATPEAVQEPYQNYVAITCKTTECNRLYLDGSSISQATFSKTWTSIHGPQTPMSVCIVKISHGTHTLSHPDPTVAFGIQIYGQVKFESYGFPGGTLIAPLYGACVPTSVVVNDGFDNDCDGRIDEELADGLDNDGDGNVDEDTAQQTNPLFTSPTTTSTTTTTTVAPTTSTSTTTESPLTTTTTEAPMTTITTGATTTTSKTTEAPVTTTSTKGETMRTTTEAPTTTTTTTTTAEAKITTEAPTIRIISEAPTLPLPTTTTNTLKSATTDQTNPDGVKNQNSGADGELPVDIILATVIPGVVVLLTTTICCCCLLAAIRRRRKEKKKKKPPEDDGEEEELDKKNNKTQNVTVKTIPSKAKSTKSPVVPINLAASGDADKDDWIYSRSATSSPRTEVSELTPPGSPLSLNNVDTSLPITESDTHSTQHLEIGRSSGTKDFSNHNRLISNRIYERNSPRNDQNSQYRNYGSPQRHANYDDERRASPAIKNHRRSSPPPRSRSPVYPYRKAPSISMDPRGNNRDLAYKSRQPDARHPSPRGIRYDTHRERSTPIPRSPRGDVDSRGFTYDSRHTSLRERQTSIRRSPKASMDPRADFDHRDFAFTTTHPSPSSHNSDTRKEKMTYADGGNYSNHSAAQSTARSKGYSTSSHASFYNVKHLTYKTTDPQANSQKFSLSYKTSGGTLSHKPDWSVNGISNNQKDMDEWWNATGARAQVATARREPLKKPARSDYLNGF